MSAHFGEYHDLIEGKLLNLAQSTRHCEAEDGRSSDRLKEIEREYKSLTAQHEELGALAKDLKRKYAEVVGAQQLGSESVQCMEQELRSLRNCVAEWQRKWDSLRRTPARYYVDGYEMAKERQKKGKTKKHSKYQLQRDL